MHLSDHNEYRAMSTVQRSVLHPALLAAKARWAAAQDHHALRGTPSREMTRDHQEAKLLGTQPQKDAK